MRRQDETILLFESYPYVRSQYSGVLNQLGYWRLLFANYTEGPGFAAGIAPFDAVVAVWTEPGIDVNQFAGAVANATSLLKVRGALIVSPFTNEDNVRLLGRSGAKGWARPPVSNGELAARLRVLLHGDRRVAAERRLEVRHQAADRRHMPLYPLPMSA